MKTTVDDTSTNHVFDKVNKGYYYANDNDLRIAVLQNLDFFHILLCYSQHLKCIKLRLCVTGRHTIHHNVKVELCFKNENIIIT